MGKLNIAHHKSYHPYRLDNIERVRRDEEEARLKEAQEEGRVTMADSEARIALLRERAKAESKPSKHKQQREEEQLLQSGNPLISGSTSETVVTKERGLGGALTLTAASGHVNFFEELEFSHQNALEHNSHSSRAKDKATKEKELEKGVPLMPDAKDRNPWYLDKGLKHPKDMTDEEIKAKDAEPESEKEKWGRRPRANKVSSKAALDPLAEMQSHLATRARVTSARSGAMPPPPPRPSSSTSLPKDATSERIARETAERARAEALIARRRAALEASSSVGGDTPMTIRDGGYSDGYNKTETRAAHEAWERERQRGRHGDRRWDEDEEDWDRDRRSKSSSSSKDRSRDTWRDSGSSREWERERERERDRRRHSEKRREERDRTEDMPRGERNRTRGVEDIRRA